MAARLVLVLVLVLVLELVLVLVLVLELVLELELELVLELVLVMALVPVKGWACPGWESPPSQVDVRWPARPAHAIYTGGGRVGEHATVCKRARGMRCVGRLCPPSQDQGRGGESHSIQQRTFVGPSGRESSMRTRA